MPSHPEGHDSSVPRDNPQQPAWPVAPLRTFRLVVALESKRQASGDVEALNRTRSWEQASCHATTNAPQRLGSDGAGMAIKCRRLGNTAKRSGSTAIPAEVAGIYAASHTLPVAWKIAEGMESELNSLCASSSEPQNARPPSTATSCRAPPCRSAGKSVV